MKLILVNQRHGHTRTVILKGWMKGLLSICLLGAPVALGYLGYQLAISGTASFLTEDVARNWQQQLSLQEAELKQLRNDSKRELEALSLRLAMMQARLARLDAMGERITRMSDFDNGEFDFSQPVVAIGGPTRGDNELSESGFISALDRLESQVEDRLGQLQILEDLLDDRKIQSDIFIAGRPLEKGWIASRFGQRPFHWSNVVSCWAGFHHRSRGCRDQHRRIRSCDLVWAPFRLRADG